MKQGIELHWSGRRHPQTQGKVERFHGELERALHARNAYLGHRYSNHAHQRRHECTNVFVLSQHRSVSLPIK
jgi:transposase InsO family protein